MDLGSADFAFTGESIGEFTEPFRDWASCRSPERRAGGTDNGRAAGPGMTA